MSLRSCSGTQGNPAQKLLLTFLFWLLLNGPLGMKQRRCISLQLSIWPTICWHELFPLEKCLKDDVAVTQLLDAPLLPHPAYVLKGTLVWANVTHVTQWNRIGHCSNYFRFPHLLFPPLILPGLLSAHQLVIPFTLWARCRQQDVSTFSFKVSLTTYIAFLTSFWIQWLLKMHSKHHMMWCNLVIIYWFT